MTSSNSGLHHDIGEVFGAGRTLKHNFGRAHIKVTMFLVCLGYVGVVWGCCVKMDMFFVVLGKVGGIWGCCMIKLMCFLLFGDLT